MASAEIAILKIHATTTKINGCEAKKYYWSPVIGAFTYVQR
jgi:hypothetical protein